MTNVNDNSRNNNGVGAIVFAGLTMAIAALAVSLAHRPTRKRIRGGLIDAIDKTDRKLDEMDSKARDFAAEAGRKVRRTQTDSVKELQHQLSVIQKELDKLK